MRKLFRLDRLIPSLHSVRSQNVAALKAQMENAPQCTKHRQYVPLYDLIPSIGPGCFISPTASIIGEVSLGHDCTLWSNAVIRGDLNSVNLNSYVTVGERSVIHTAASLPNGFPAKVEIGNFVVIQSNCTLYSCTIGDEVLVGHRSVIMEGSKLENGSAIGPNSVVPPGRIIPANQLWAGNPVQYIRDLEKNEVFQFNQLAKSNSDLADTHNYEFLPFNSAYLQKENTNDDVDPKQFTGQTTKSDELEDYK